MATTTQTHLRADLVFLLNKRLMSDIITDGLPKEKSQNFGYNEQVFDFQQKRKIRSIINSPLTQVVILMLALWIGYSAYIRYEIAMEMLDRSREAQVAALALEAKKESLEAEVEYLSSERGLEAEMRRQFDVALPGEQVVVIVDKENDGPEILPLATSTKVKPDKKWYQFWR